MDGSSEAYEGLIEIISNTFPDVASEIQDEIRQGHSVYASGIAAEDREYRQQLLSEENLGRIAKNDVTFRQYDSDERLLALLEALRTLATSMSATRQSLVIFGQEHDLRSPYVVFADPDESGEPSAHVADADFSTDPLDEAAAIIGAALHEVGESS